MPSQAGEFDRYLDLLRPLQRQLETFCRRALNNPSLVEDALQNVVAKTIADFGTFVEGTNFRAWIFRYLHYEILNCNRREATTSTTIGESCETPSWEQLVAEESFDRLLVDSEDILDHCDEAIANAVNRLNDAERSVFLLRAIGEFKHAEIAEMLNMPVGTVMSHLSRSRAGLRYGLVQFATERGHFRRPDAPPVPPTDDPPVTQGENP